MRIQITGYLASYKVAGNSRLLDTHFSTSQEVEQKQWCERNEALGRTELVCQLQKTFLVRHGISKVISHSMPFTVFA